VIVAAALLIVRTAAAQQRPLDTQDPQPIDPGLVRLGVGVTYAWDQFYTLSGLKGNLLQLPVIGLQVGLSPIAEFQLSGGPYNHLSITDRQPAPLADVVTATGDSTHDVEDIVIGTKIRLLSEQSNRPAVAFQFAVRLPNSKHASGMGQDTTDFRAVVPVGKTWGVVRLVGNGGFMIMSQPLDAGKQNDVVIYGGSLTVAGSHHTDLVGEINGRWSVRQGEPPVGTESRGLAKVGFRHTHGPLQIDAAALFGVTSIDPTAGFTVGLSYTFKAFSLE